MARQGCKTGRIWLEPIQDIPSNDEKTTLAAWDKHLRQVLTFPLQAEVNEFQEKGPQPP